MKMFLLFSQVSAGRQPRAMETMLSKYSVILMNFSKCNNVLIIKPTALRKSKEKSQYPPQNFEPFLSWLGSPLASTEFWEGNQVLRVYTECSSSAFWLFLCSHLHPILWTLHDISCVALVVSWDHSVREKREASESSGNYRVLPQSNGPQFSSR